MKKYYISFFEDHSSEIDQKNAEYAAEKAESLPDVMRKFKIDCEVTKVVPSSRNVLYHVHILNRINYSVLPSLAENIGMHWDVSGLKVLSVPMEKDTVGFVIDNPYRTTVSLGTALEKMEEQDNDNPLLYCIGQNLYGRFDYDELNRSSPFMISGATGSGSMAFLHAMLCTMILRSEPDDVKFVLIDTKRIEFLQYKGIPHLISPIVTDPVEAVKTLMIVQKIMNERLNILAATGHKSIEEYNVAVENQPKTDLPPAKKMPRIVVVVDDVADITAENKTEFEYIFSDVSVHAQACGISFVLVTQRVHSFALQGSMTHMFNSIAAFRVFSEKDSMTPVSLPGAEKLIPGEFIMKSYNHDHDGLHQAPIISDAEVSRITDSAEETGIPIYDDYFIVSGTHDRSAITTANDDPMYEDMKEYVIQAQKASISLLQRRFGIGYNRAARVIDALETEGVIGPAIGSRPREVYMYPDDLKKSEPGKVYKKPDEVIKETIPVKPAPVLKQSSEPPKPAYTIDELMAPSNKERTETKVHKSYETEESLSDLIFLDEQNDDGVIDSIDMTMTNKLFGTKELGLNYREVIKKAMEEETDTPEGEPIDSAEEVSDPPEEEKHIFSFFRKKK